MSVFCRPRSPRRLQTRVRNKRTRAARPPVFVYNSTQRIGLGEGNVQPLFSQIDFPLDPLGIEALWIDLFVMRMLLQYFGEMRRQALLQANCGGDAHATASFA